MRLLLLKISGYKNLKRNVIFDFSQCSDYAALIGLNGSGKSNVLEAISIIFASLYTAKKTRTWNENRDICYTIRYQFKNYEIEITDGIIKLIKEGGQDKNKIIRSNKQEYLPSEVIVCYSGDELRLWKDIYSKFYFSYLTKISKGYRNSKQNLVYLNKYSWEFALLCLLCNEQSHEYLKDLLKVDDLATVGIKFHFAKNYESRKRWFSKRVESGLESINEITELIQRIKDEQERTNEDLAYTQISSIELRVNQNNAKFCRKLFYLLFAAGMPKKNKLFEKIEIKFNRIALKHLSEGEKRLILIKCIMDVLSNENSLILFDEPDSHLHISRKKELKTLLDKQGYYSLITTHSPTLLNSINEENSFILNDKGRGVEVNQSSKFTILKQITDGEFSLMDGVVAISSKKDIILVEGKYDEKYITKALKYFESQDIKYAILNFVFVNAGGAGNILQIFNKIYRSISNRQLFITLCDDDTDGRSAVADVTKKITKLKKSNFIAMVYPKTNKKRFPNDFLLEDYFPLKAYKDVYTKKLSKAIKHKDLEAFPCPKNHIQKSYSKFKPEYYAQFKKLIDELFKLKQNQ